jgi:hypothetical protein
MALRRNKFYILISASCTAGYIWLIISNAVSGIHKNDIGLCIFKHVTTMPCPSCGSTRSLLALLKGNLLDSLYWNPIGIIIALFLLIAPVIIIYDGLSHKSTLFNLYNKMEQIVRQKWVAVPAIMLIMVNWIWNIHKGL